MLKKAGFTLWDSCAFDETVEGMTTEQVYDRDCKDSNSKKRTIPGTGADLALPGPNVDMKAEAEEWKERVIRAAEVARSRGHMPASFEGLVKEFTEPVYPVWLLLESFLDTILHDEDQSWANPNMVYLPYGIVMPGAYSELVSEVFLWYDTSGSVPNQDLSKFHRVGGDIIRKAMPKKLWVGQCDASVTSIIEIHHSTDWPSEIKITGRGGTSFRLPFEWMAAHHIRPSVMIYLTDLEGDFPEIAPPFPVIWVSTTALKAPWGRTIHMTNKD
jgi:predicted metal-dependent peptidase